MNLTWEQGKEKRGANTGIMSNFENKVTNKQEKLWSLSSWSYACAVNSDHNNWCYWLPGV